MKGLFLMFYGFNAYNGISKKIEYQVNAMRQHGLDLRICHYEIEENGNRCWMIGHEVLQSLGCGICAKLKKRIDFSPIIRYAKQEKIDFIYWRTFHNSNPFTIHLAKELRKSNVRIILEIPTFPYDQEYASHSEKLTLMGDQLVRKQFCKYVDRIVTFSNDEEIFGRPTIRISNGIDFSKIPLRQSMHDVSKELHLVAVAEIHYWHGYDRLIEGLYRYYQANPKYKVHFHLAGPISGEREQHEVVDAVSNYHLEQYVHLYGPLHGEALEELFNKGDFAIGSLGRHRSGITHIKTLKNREYAARGIPFIYSENDSDFDHQPYILKAPADESPISIRQILDFIDHQPLSPSTIRSSVEHLSWKNQMEIVITRSPI